MTGTGDFSFFFFGAVADARDDRITYASLIIDHETGFVL
jgi:hypothetical protein